MKPLLSRNGVSEQTITLRHILLTMHKTNCRRSQAQFKAMAV